MNLEEYKQHLKEMNDDELMAWIHDIRRNREQSMSVTRVAAVKKKTQGKSAKSAIASLSTEEKAELRKKFGL